MNLFQDIDGSKYYLNETIGIMQTTYGIILIKFQELWKMGGFKIVKNGFN